MSSMVQGDAYSLDVTIKNNGSPINIADVKAVEFTLFNFKKIYPGEAEYSDGKFHIPPCVSATVTIPRPFRQPAISL